MTVCAPLQSHKILSARLRTKKVWNVVNLTSTAMSLPIEKVSTLSIVPNINVPRPKFNIKKV